MHKVYLAAPIFTPPQLKVVERIYKILVDRKFMVFSPYHNSQEIWQGRAPKDCTPEERGRVLTDNINGLDWCDILLCWVGGMGGFTDPGVVWEMGYAHRVSRQRNGGLLTLAYIDDTDKRSNMNLMLAGTVDAVAKGFEELDRALRYLQPGSSDWAIVKDSFHPDRHIEHEREPIV